VTRAVTTVLGTLPQLRALRPEFEAEFRKFDLKSFDKLADYTLAVHHAHTRWRAASRPRQALSELGGKLEELRGRLLTDARSLAGHGVIDGKRLDECGLPGYRAMASDVLVVVNLLKDNWAKVQGRTPLSIDGLNTAAAQALDLLSEVGLRDQAPAVVDDAALRRRKAFTLFRRTYEAARNAVIYLHGEGGADEIAPSLYAGRGKRNGADATTESGEHPVELGSPNGGGASTPNGGNTTLRATANGAAGEQFVVDNAAGLPITHPLKK
jgi:hypothetical protein